MNNPYKSQPDRAFWNRCVSKNFETTELTKDFSNALSLNDKVVSAGSCFASNLIPYLEENGIKYLRTEVMPNVLSNLGENLGYGNFSASYGNIYTARQLRQLYERAIGEFRPIEDRWFKGNLVIDPFRPGLRFPAESNDEFDFLRESHFDATRRAFESADVFVFTLGLTESWVHKKDGATYPACPGTIAGNFDPELYEFKNFTVEEIVEDLEIFINKIRKRNHKVRFILTVSPVPLVATATDQHVLLATIFSKSILRVAAEEIRKKCENVFYFPAYEIITGPNALGTYFEADKRNVSKEGVDLVMKTLLNSCGLLNNQNNKLNQYILETDKMKKFSNEAIMADCDEAMTDQELR